MDFYDANRRMKTSYTLVNEEEEPGPPCSLKMACHPSERLRNPMRGDIFSGY